MILLLLSTVNLYTEIEDPLFFLWNDARLDNCYTYRSELPLLYYSRYKFHSTSEVILEKGDMSRLFLGFNFSLYKNKINAGVIYDTLKFYSFQNDYYTSFINIYSNIYNVLFDYRKILRAYSFFSDSTDSIVVDSLPIESFSIEYKTVRLSYLKIDSSPFIESNVSLGFLNFVNSIYIFSSFSDLVVLDYNLRFFFNRVHSNLGVLYINNSLYPIFGTRVEFHNFNLYFTHHLNYSRIEYLTLKRDILENIYKVGISNTFYSIETGINNKENLFISGKLMFNRFATGFYYDSNIIKYEIVSVFDSVYFLWGIKEKLTVMSKNIVNGAPFEINIDFQSGVNFTDVFELGVKFYNITSADNIYYKSSLPLNLKGWIFYLQWVLPD